MGYLLFFGDQDEHRRFVFHLLVEKNGSVKTCVCFLASESAKYQALVLNVDVTAEIFLGVFIYVDEIACATVENVVFAAEVAAFYLEVVGGVKHRVQRTLCYNGTPTVAAVAHYVVICGVVVKRTLRVGLGHPAFDRPVAVFHEVA